MKTWEQFMWFIIITIDCINKRSTLISCYSCCMSLKVTNLSSVQINIKDFTIRMRVFSVLFRVRIHDYCWCCTFTPIFLTVKFTDTDFGSLFLPNQWLWYEWLTKKKCQCLLMKETDIKKNTDDCSKLLSLTLPFLFLSLESLILKEIEYLFPLFCRSMFYGSSSSLKKKRREAREP